MSLNVFRFIFSKKHFRTIICGWCIFFLGNEHDMKIALYVYKENASPYTYIKRIIVIFKYYMYRLSPPPKTKKKKKKKPNRHLGIDCKRTLYGIWKIKPDFETMTIFLQFSEDPYLIWPSGHKEIWIFVKQVIGPFLPSFVTWMYVASIGRLCSQKTGFAIIFKFHAYLSNKGCSWQPKSLSDM